MFPPAARVTHQIHPSSFRFLDPITCDLSNFLTSFFASPPLLRYTVMSGTPQKMLEHLLETRLGGQAGPNDPFLDDFLLTHIVFMPTPILIDELASTYHADTEVDMRTASEEDQEYFMTCKRRVVQFIQRWVLAVRHAVFDDPLAVEFIEVSVLGCYFMESHYSPGASSVIRD